MAKTNKMTRDHAITRLVDMTVAKYGEGERTAAQRMYATYTVGRALNAIANFDLDALDAGVQAQADARMTRRDLRDLRDAAVES